MFNCSLQAIFFRLVGQASPSAVECEVCLAQVGFDTTHTHTHTGCSLILTAGGAKRQNMALEHLNMKTLLEEDSEDEVKSSQDCRYKQLVPHLKAVTSKYSTLNSYV